MTVDVEPKSFFDILRADMRAMDLPHSGILAMIYYVFRWPNFLAVLLYRLSSVCIDKGILGTAAAQFFWRLNIFLTSCKINPRAKIGAGFSLTHPVGVVIGRVVIGRNVEVYQGVTMGDQRRDDPYTGPDSRAQVGDGATIYTGAVLVGGVKIGQGASVGANAVVLQNVPDDCLAVGVPARIVERKERVG